MLAKPLRFVLGSLRFRCSVGKKLGFFVRLAAAVLSLRRPHSLVFSDQQRRPRAGFAGLATLDASAMMHSVDS
jgi:hypothetical protein